jgi:hypothetical protein
MRNFKEMQQQLNLELDHFSTIIQHVLPTYIRLIEKPTLTQLELIELGEIEYYLLELNDKLNCIREVIAKELFGATFENYYHQKNKLINQDTENYYQLVKLKTAFEKEIKEGGIIIWN